MILTLQCHLFDHIISNGNSTLYSKMGRILSISWGNGAQNNVCRHPLRRLLRVYFSVELFHSLSFFKLIPMILTLQCHLFDHIFCNGKSTLYSKMGRILSISWGNGAQNNVCRHPLRRLLRVYFSVELFHSLSFFKLIPMILTLQCHLFDHIFCNGKSTLYSKMGRILSISWGNGAQNNVCRHPLRRLLRVYFSVELFHSLSFFKLIPMILTLQCHLQYFITYSATEIQRSSTISIVPGSLARVFALSSSYSKSRSTLGASAAFVELSIDSSNIKKLVFDTTSVNSGIKKGVVVQVKKVFWMTVIGFGMSPSYTRTCFWGSMHHSLWN